MKNEISKYKLLSILYPIIHTICYTLIVLLSTGDKNVTLIIAFFLFHALSVVIFFSFFELKDKRILNFFCNAPKFVLTVAFILLGISIFFCVLSHFTFVDQNGNVEVNKDRYIICSLIYLLSSSWFFIYLKVKRLEERNE